MYEFSVSLARCGCFSVYFYILFILIPIRSIYQNAKRLVCAHVCEWRYTQHSELIYHSLLYSVIIFVCACDKTYPNRSTTTTTINKQINKQQLLFTAKISMNTNKQQSRTFTFVCCCWCCCHIIIVTVIGQWKRLLIRFLFFFFWIHKIRKSSWNSTTLNFIFNQFEMWTFTRRTY